MSKLDGEAKHKAGVRIVVDADGCPVKDEVAKVAKRLNLQVTFVANRAMRIPQGKGFRLEVVPELFDAADDWIAENCDARTVVICGDIPLASRCVAAGANVVDPRGRILDEESVGEALARRDLSTHLRDLGLPTKGPAPFTPRDRSSFLQAMDRVLQPLLRD
ncbi:MAG: YaiI/YqxD family protein [Planctomycetes bacterium]|nr:YaiI/YqxD family protein [Planctomycetota bacterium]